MSCCRCFRRLRVLIVGGLALSLLLMILFFSHSKNSTVRSKSQHSTPEFFLFGTKVLVTLFIYLYFSLNASSPLSYPLYSYHFFRKDQTLCDGFKQSFDVPSSDIRFLVLQKLLGYYICGYFCIFAHICIYKVITVAHSSQFRLRKP